MNDTWISILVAAPIALFIAAGVYLHQHPAQTTAGRSITVLESLIALSSIRGTEYPHQAKECERHYELLDVAITEGMMRTDIYRKDTAPGDRALGYYWRTYQATRSCVASGHYPPRKLVDTIETLAIWLEMMDYQER